MVDEQRRSCCGSTENTWHLTDCKLGGPTGPQDVYGGMKRYWEGEEYWPELRAEREALAPRVQDTYSISVEPNSTYQIVGAYFPFGPSVAIVADEHCRPHTVIAGTCIFDMSTQSYWLNTNGRSDGWEELAKEPSDSGPNVCNGKCEPVCAFCEPQRVITEGEMDTVRLIESDRIPPGPIVVGEFTHSGTEIVRALAGVDFGYDARALALIPHRWCCGGLPTDAHLSGCPTNFFAEGQTVIKPDMEWSLGPGSIWPASTRLRIREDKASSDRTFENETRLH